VKARRGAGRQDKPLAGAVAGQAGEAAGTLLGAVAMPPAVEAPGRIKPRERDVSPAAPPRATPAARGARRITTETALYGLIFIAAVVSRFWDLGSRALHHDESLHAYFSWLYATGGGYIHDPLMHGPFLFHVTALAFLLLGDSNATARVTPALFGVGIVMLPYLLRGPRQLGRWGALAASALLLVSPSILYYSRFLRHDVYTVFGTLLLFAAIVRYVERPARRWLLTGTITLILLFTNHEVIFIIALSFAIYLWGALLWGRLRALIPLQIATLAVAASSMRRCRASSPAICRRFRGKTRTGPRSRSSSTPSSPTR